VWIPALALLAGIMWLQHRRRTHEAEPAAAAAPAAD
jgi:hypothetical protein